MDEFLNQVRILSWTQSNNSSFCLGLLMGITFSIASENERFKEIESKLIKWKETELEMNET